MFRRIGGPGIHGVGGMGVSDLGASCPAAPPPGGWWLSGGILAANCLIAYTPKGAANLAASYDNNAAPGNGLPDGTYDAALGVAPTFNSVTGWTFDGIAQYLSTAYTPGVPQTLSQIIRFANVPDAPGSNVWLCGTIGGAGTYMSLTPNYDGAGNNWHIYRANTQALVNPRLASGVMGTAGTQCYLNGVGDGALGAAGGAMNFPYFIGCHNNGGLPGQYLASDVLAFAFYNTILTGPQMLAVATAMAAI